MLVIGMKPHEMMTELSADFNVLQRYIATKGAAVKTAFDRDKNLRQMLYDWTSKRGNKWHIMLNIDGEHLAITYWTTMDSRYGRFVMKIQLTNVGYILFVFLPHFFRRYRERMNLGDKMTTEQVVRRYFRRNGYGNYGVNRVGEMEIATADGVGLGISLGIRERLMKTFITFEMAKGDQVERFAQQDEERKKFQRKRQLFPDEEVHNEMMALGLSDEEICKQYLQEIIKSCMEIKCVLKQRVGSQTGTSKNTGNAWRTDEWLAVVPGQYEKKMVFEVRGVERCRQWEEFFNGMADKNTPVLIRFEIDARSVEKDGNVRWFNSVQAWDICTTTW